MNAFVRFKTFLHYAWLFAGRVVKEKRRWRAVSQKGYNQARVFFGHERIPDRSQNSGGAIIKLQDLTDVFPNTLRDANLLYLINSAMPVYAPVMVREARQRGALFVLNQNGVAYAGWHGPGWERLNRPMRYLLRNADFVIYQSRFCKLGADKFLGTCRVPWKILYNPVDTRVFVPPDKKPAGLRILLAGSHQHFYRVKIAIEMLAQLRAHFPQAVLTVAGRYSWKKPDGECVSEARSWAESLGVGKNVVLKGPYSQKEAVALFQSCHVLLHTKYNDPCPRLVVEGMACGLPVVYSASGGVPELVGADAGIGIQTPLDWEMDHPPNPQKLSEAVCRVLENRERFSRAARKRAADRFDVRNWIKEHESVFQHLLQKRLARRRQTST